MPIGVERGRLFDIALVSSSGSTTSLVSAIHNWIHLPILEIIIIDKCLHTKLSEIIPSYLLQLEEYKKVRIYCSETRWTPIAKNIIICEPDQQIKDDFFYSQISFGSKGVFKIKNNILEELPNYVDYLSIDYTKDITHLFNEERFVVLKPLFGIGNRLRALLTTLYFTEKNRYKLYVLWEKTAGYDDSSFKECFKIKNSSNITFIDSFTILSKIDFNVTIHSEDVKKLIDIEHDNKIYIQTGSYLQNVLCSENNFTITCDYFKDLYPSNSIESIVDFITNNLIGGDYNVFHIRRGDALTSQFSEHYKFSSIYLFAKYIKESDKINVVLSDDYDYCSRFLNVICPNKYIIINRNNFNKDKTYMDYKYAVNMDVVDFFLCRKAHTLYSTSFSSFSYVAAHVFNKKDAGFIVVKDTNRFCLNNSSENADFLPYVNSYKNSEGGRPFISKLDCDGMIIKDTIIYLEESRNIILDIFNKYYKD